MLALQVALVVVHLMTCLSILIQMHLTNPLPNHNLNLLDNLHLLDNQNRLGNQHQATILVNQVITQVNLDTIQINPDTIQINLDTIQINLDTTQTTQINPDTTQIDLDTTQINMVEAVVCTSRGGKAQLILVIYVNDIVTGWGVLAGLGYKPICIILRANIFIHDIHRGITLYMHSVSCFILCVILYHVIKVTS